jgi:hypothetical protein
VLIIFLLMLAYNFEFPNLPTNEKQSRVAEETVLTNRKPENIAKIVHYKEAVNIINPICLSKPQAEINEAGFPKLSGPCSDRHRLKMKLDLQS